MKARSLVRTATRTLLVTYAVFWALSIAIGRASKVQV